MQSETTIQPTVTSPSAVSPAFFSQPAGYGPVCTNKNQGQCRRPPEWASIATWHLRWRP